MTTSAVSDRRSARRAVKRRKMSSSGNVVGSIIAESISTQPPTTSDPVSVWRPPGKARQRLPAAPISAQLPWSSQRA
ncbi:MAG TPA: hypothetical protein VHT00_00450 [Stellaceae bacterium]|nr:hypothetical protein [Stellaceae bacterium]